MYLLEGSTGNGDFFIFSTIILLYVVEDFVAMLKTLAPVG